MLGLAKRTHARILQASTSEVYGDPEVHPQPETYKGNVNPIGPRSCYDEGKRCAEVDAQRNPRTAEMAAKLQTAEGKAAYRRRKWIAEPPNGWIKSVLGFRQFSLRGLHRVQAEFKLVCLALNLRRMGTTMAR